MRDKTERTPWRRKKAPVFLTPEHLQEAIDKYFDETPLDELTISGLGLSLGLSTKALTSYAGREDFSDMIARAKQVIENSYELALRRNGRSGDIFALKNFGWKDENTMNVSGNFFNDVIARANDTKNPDIANIGQVSA